MNRDLAENPRAIRLAQQLENRSMRVRAGSLLDLRAEVQGGRLWLGPGEPTQAVHPTPQATPGGPAAAEAEISGTPLAMIGLFRQASATPSAGSAVQVRGDAEVANRFRELFRLLRPDVESQMVRLLGDAPARALSRAGTAALDWARQALDSSRRNIAEYLVEESRDLVNRTELEEFLRGVDLAREGTDRAEARLALLERRRGARC